MNIVLLRWDGRCWDRDHNTYAHSTRTYWSPVQTVESRIITVRTGRHIPLIPDRRRHDTIVNGPASFLSSEKNKGLTHIERLEQNARRNGSIRTIQAIQLHDREGGVVIIFVGIVVNNIEEG